LHFVNFVSKRIRCILDANNNEVINTDCWSIPVSILPPSASRTVRTQSVADSAAGCSTDNTWRRSPVPDSTLYCIYYPCLLRSAINKQFLYHDPLPDSYLLDCV